MATTTKKRVLNWDGINSLVSKAVARVKSSMAGLKTYSTADERHAALGEKSRRDLTAATFRKGDIIFFSPENEGIAPINGSSTNTASVCICPAISQGKAVVKQLYASTVGRTIQEYDESGARVLRNGEPGQIEGTGNSIWEAAQDCPTDDAVFDLFTNADGTGKILVVTGIMQGNGPRFARNGSGDIVGNRLMRVPLFTVYDSVQDALDAGIKIPDQYLKDAA